ncbi:hypothetical protein MIND_00444400 [Mycena indigotica]|uniref:Uncharacterized protein n=1 Tax=Mycena indigotica TaxID=2126181 RepID=A0A8H6SW40_9AGAR|nr:uncharacterized protein MIND_00444400 [Mycena indigotica]KAF7306531.1 hypothetical protein MIND_00444400 [Mycena indigotica]
MHSKYNHHKRDLNVSNLFGGGKSQPAESAASTADPTSSAADNGGLLGALSSLFNRPAPASSSVVSETTTSPPTVTTTPPPAPPPPPPTHSDTLGPVTRTVFSTENFIASSSSASASASSEPDTTSAVQTSKVAAAIVGSLAGILGIAMVVAFFLRRWNRRQRRLARESINFFPEETPNRKSALPFSAQALSPEPKEAYSDTASVSYQYRAATPVYPQEPVYQPVQQPVYSAFPATDSQRVMEDYQVRNAAYGGVH